MNPLNVYAYNKLSKALKLALSFQEITFEDMLKTDDEVLALLKNSNSKDIVNLINSLNPNVKVRENNLNYHIHQINKLRLIDPLIHINNKISRASEKSNVIKALNEQALKSSLDGVYVEILSI